MANAMMYYCVSYRSQCGYNAMMYCCVRSQCYDVLLCEESML